MLCKKKSRSQAAFGTGRPALRSAAGFTLVELIVVIAILAILAGVGTVAYSGYIKKAHQAADNQLLGIISTAFASACAENGTANTAFRTDAVRLQTTGQEITGVSCGNKDIEASFKKYFAGNDGTLTYYKNDGDIHFRNGLFVGVDSDGNYTVTVNGVTVTVPESDITAYQQSGFGQNMTTAELIDAIDSVKNMAQSALSSNTADASLFDRLNAGDELATLLRDGFELTEEDMKKLTEDQLMNAVILLAAQNVPSDALGVIAPDSYDNQNDCLGNAAAQYAIMTAFANNPAYSTLMLSDGTTVADYYAQATADLANANGGQAGATAVNEMMMTLYEQMVDSGYVEVDESDPDNVVVSGDQFLADYAGYQAAMNMINSNVSNLNREEFLDGGLGSMSELLAQIFGS